MPTNTSKYANDSPAAKSSIYNIFNDIIIKSWEQFTEIDMSGLRLTIFTKIHGKAGSLKISKYLSISPALMICWEKL